MPSSIAVILGYTGNMKTAISLPDALFERVDIAAAEQGVSRSAFLARAAERYLQHLDNDSLEDRINEAIAAVGDPRDEWAVQQGSILLADRSETW